MKPSHLWESKRDEIVDSQDDAMRFLIASRNLDFVAGEMKEIDYEESDIDITEYNRWIIIRSLLFTHSEKNACRIYTGCIPICKIYK